LRQVSTKGQGKQRFKFVVDTISELRKVVWPTRQEASYLTTIIIIVTVIMAIILWVVDLGFSELMSIILF
jgi:preprotein translocase subunit SecE